MPLIADPDKQPINELPAAAGELTFGAAWLSWAVPWLGAPWLGVASLGVVWLGVVALGELVSGVCGDCAAGGLDGELRSGSVLWPATQLVANSNQQNIVALYFIGAFLLR